MFFPAGAPAMNLRSPAGRRFFLVTIVVGVLGAILCSARLDAQGFRPPRSGMPNIPPPNLGGPGNPRIPNGPQPPQFERVWTCSHCGAELGRGPTMPRIDKCPKCGTRFINGTNPFPVDPPPGNNPAPPSNGNPPPTPPPWNPPDAEPPVVSSPVVNMASPSATPTSGSPASLIMVVIVIGILIVTALVIVGFVVLVMWIVKSANRPAPRRPLY
jgi:DNA-directed RNA polymerase subunit RPC12/RpoP